MAESMSQVVYKSNKLILEFFMYMPQVSKWNETYSTKCSPILSLRKLTPANTNDDVGDFKSRTFKITTASYYKTVMFFNDIVSWFYDKEKPDLFLKNDDGKLIFNGDYKDLSAYVEAGFNEVSRMKAMPAAIDLGDKTVEGIYLMINNKETIIVLTLREVEILLEVLSQFTFNSYAFVLKTQFIHLMPFSVSRQII